MQELVTLVMVWMKNIALKMEVEVFYLAFYVENITRFHMKVPVAHLALIIESD